MRTSFLAVFMLAVRHSCNSLGLKGGFLVHLPMLLQTAREK